MPLFERWLEAPHLREWFGDWRPEVTRPDVRSWLISVHGAPLGFLQDYRIGDFEDHPLAALPPDGRGIDQFIGPVEELGKGHGPAFIRQHVEAMLADGVPAIGTDPDPANTRAIRAYEKAGFRTLGPAVDSKWGRTLPMGLWPGDQLRGTRQT